MSDIQYLPISCLDESAILPLMTEEARMWLTDFGWDYSAIQQVLLSLIREKILPGYVAFTGDKQPVGYVYFLVNQTKGSIGALYATPTTSADKAQETADGLLELAVTCLQNSGNIRRIEAQILPLHGQNYARTFNKCGFRDYPRFYLVRSIAGIAAGITEKEPCAPAKIIPWDSAIINRAAAMTTECYREHPDYEIFEDYHTQSNCESYLYGLVTNPGCGIFLPNASFMYLDGGGNPRGYVICSRISDGSALIPQIVTHPSWQGRGIGAALMNRCLMQLQSMNFHSLSLVVTVENSRACELYRRMGFQLRREFGAFIWNRV